MKGLIARAGELLVDGYGNYGIVLVDVPSRPEMTERKILVFRSESGYDVSDITIKAWWRPEANRLVHIFTCDVIQKRYVIG